MRRTGVLRIAPFILGIAALIAWEAAVRLGGIPAYVLPGPLLVLQTLWTDGPSLLGFPVGDPAHHRAGADRRGARRHAARGDDGAVAADRAQPVSLCGDPAGDADRRHRAAHHHLGQRHDARPRAVRLDRRLLSHRVEHHDRPEQRRPQSGRPVPALRREPLADAVAAALSRRPAAISSPACASAAGSPWSARWWRNSSPAPAVPKPGSPSAFWRPATGCRFRACSPRWCCSALTGIAIYLALDWCRGGCCAAGTTAPHSRSESPHRHPAPLDHDQIKKRPGTRPGRGAAAMCDTV